MIEGIDLETRNIFVGRKKEIQRLRKLLQLASNKRENLVYVMLNAPGVGKTTLINKFGSLMEVERLSIHLPFVASSDYDEPTSLNRDLLICIQDAIREKKILINEFIDKVQNEEEKSYFLNHLQIIKKAINTSLMKDRISIDDVMFPFKRLSAIIPIIFTTDEIQEFQKFTFLEQEMNENETGLHYYTRILKNFLKSRILLILSGTRYHILSQIGNKIGSPIREKVHPIVLGNFSTAEITEYAIQVEKLIENDLMEKRGSSLKNIMVFYRRFLLAFSGGHPRTIERITIEVLNTLSLFLGKKRYRNYESFMDYLLPLTTQTLHGTLLTKEKERELLALRDHELFGRVKEWIINKSHNGFLLGFPPEFGIINQETEEIQDIIYDLMNLGFVVQNGNSNYYLTSYYHLVAFLKPFQEEEEAFLKQVLYNKHFKLMCGSHSGFGYTFENVLSAALLIQGSESPTETKIPFNILRIRESNVLQGNINWEDTSLKEDIFYQTPQARAIDAFIFQDEELVLMQITTANPPNPTKIEALNSEMETIENHLVRGWFVSLFPIKKPANISESLTVTSGDELNAILGESLSNRLRDIKQSF